MYSRYYGDSPRKGGDRREDCPDAPGLWEESADPPAVEMSMGAAPYPLNTPADLSRFLAASPVFCDQLSLERPGAVVFELLLRSHSPGHEQALLSCVMGGRAIRRLYTPAGRPVDIGAPVTVLSGAALRLYGFAFHLDRPGRWQSTAVLYPLREGRRQDPAALAAAVLWVGP